MIFISPKHQHFRFLSDRSSPQCQFRDQQFWTAIKVHFPFLLFFKKHTLVCSAAFAYPGSFLVYVSFLVTWENGICCCRSRC